MVSRFPGGTYHPKVYVFRTGDSVEAVVGSANFTSGGLGRNHEASVWMRGTIADKALADLLAFTKASAALGEPVTRDLADRYRVVCKIAARLPKPPHDPLAQTPQTDLRALTSPLTRMTWQQYIHALERPTHDDIHQSLNLLRIAQGWLSEVGSFADLTDAQRKAIAGTIGMRQRAESPGLNHEWGWFGSMRGAGDFKKLVAQNNRRLARAVDAIPLRGEVTKDDYDRFCGHFRAAFKDADRVGNVPTASRLLAMKRPDVFFCVCKPNREQASARMGFKKTTLRLENYWDRIVEVIRASEWHAAAKPDGFEGQIWESRAAMLDAILYRPD